MERARDLAKPWWTSKKDDGKEKLTGMGMGRGNRPMGDPVALGMPVPTFCPLSWLNFHAALATDLRTSPLHSALCPLQPQNLTISLDIANWQGDLLV